MNSKRKGQNLIAAENKLQVRRLKANPDATNHDIQLARCRK
ncbi:MAG: hypothetical protein BAJATHORv1_130013 [Candidatus Thorarchaeota archaeon]|nr:MAG: hypothetical protein BAJATHORv1_130013 [Candidatus Thorarchaeota archaeon]